MRCLNLLVGALLVLGNGAITQSAGQQLATSQEEVLGQPDAMV
jgi:hypothetical protein